MKKLNRLELVIIKSALLLDEYFYTYNLNDYQDYVGTMEIHRVRHVNDLIYDIANNSCEFTDIIKNISEDIDYLENEIKESSNTEILNQLNDARKILNILNQIA